ncbi:hypothetical protein IEO70_03410 [Bacillus sp. AGMB 02131]|uniref:Uncharacterized protein n=1 Tax=Peribacillus faecalis TaxID=2772559 RepID=A0A927CT58_9BACI|nr:hypothetical protein [Peribacillus faecalis]
MFHCYNTAVASEMTKWFNTNYHATLIYRT